MPTIRDVAKHAGVAPITVSRVINNAEYVSQKTRARVEASIQELGYVPNMLGPSLRFKQTMTLALVITDITNPFWTTVARGVEDVAQSQGYSVILCNTDESEEKQEQYLNMLLRRRIDGILLVPACSSPEAIHLIQRQGIPLVILDRPVPDTAVDLVTADSEAGVYQLIQHLLAQGHTRITMLTGPKTVSTAVARADGYRRALADAGLPDSAVTIFWGSYTQDGGYQMTQKALQQTPRPTAMFAANNFVAVGMLQALREEGLRIPDDISIATIDDIPSSPIIEPFVTTATQPAREMGQQATRLLLGRVTGSRTDEIQHIVLPTKLTIRASSGRKAGL